MADERLRKLEREAAQGGTEERDRLLHEKHRLGLPHRGCARCSQEQLLAFARLASTASASLGITVRATRRFSEALSGCFREVVETPGFQEALRELAKTTIHSSEELEQAIRRAFR